MNPEEAIKSANWLYEKGQVSRSFYMRILEGIYKDVFNDKKPDDHWSVDEEYKAEYEKNLAIIANQIEMEKSASRSRLESVE